MPHTYAPVEPKLYFYLSFAKFSTGYLVIIKQLADNPLREAVINHFHELMTLASTYQWSAVRSYHYKVVRSSALGLGNWGDSFEPFKQSFFLPSCLLTEAQCTVGKSASSSSTNPMESQPAIPCHQICDAWNWYNNCSAQVCPKSHICVICKRTDHKALSCPKRKFHVPTHCSNQASWGLTRLLSRQHL